MKISYLILNALLLLGLPSAVYAEGPISGLLGAVGDTVEGAGSLAGDVVEDTTGLAGDVLRGGDYYSSEYPDYYETDYDDASGSTGYRTYSAGY